MDGLRIPFGAMGLPLAAVLAVLAALPAEARPGPRFQLLTEAWISQAGGGQSGTFTAHEYDSDGKLRRTLIYIGFDAAGEVFEKREFSYHPDGLLDAQATYNGSELESRIFHRYDASGRLAEKVVQAQDGRERFRDVFAYDGQGRVSMETRMKGDSPASLHRLAYAADGSVSSDSLFEPDGSTLVPVQAALHGAGRTSGEKRESRWRFQNGVWYHVQDTFRLYQDGLHVSSAAYQVGGGRLDSSAFAYDANGNRVLEERFDGSGRPLSRLVLQWMDLQPVTLRRHARFERGSARGPILLLAGPSGTGWDLNGLDLMGRPRPRTLAAQGRPE